jgi:hypothetical protein
MDNEESRLDAILHSRMETRILTDGAKSDLLVRCATAIFVWPGTGDTVEALIADPTLGMIVGTTSAADEMFGYEEGELLFKNIEILIPERFRSGHRRHFAGFALSPIPRQMGSRLGKGEGLFGLHRAGREFPLEISLQQRMTGRQRCIIAQPAYARQNGTHS